MEALAFGVEDFALVFVALGLETLAFGLEALVAMVLVALVLVALDKVAFALVLEALALEDFFFVTTSGQLHSGWDGGAENFTVIPLESATKFKQ